MAPPVVVATTPPQGSLQFAEKGFFIEMDEYVVLKDADNNVLVSPPMAKKPLFATKGRGIAVTLKDTLRANTTYLFQFKGAIADFNEGNVMESYEYVFSTGSSIDSMTLRGSVYDALLLKAREEVTTVVLYAADTVWHDSAVAQQAPLYVTRCDKEGRFAFNYIRRGSYRIFAYEDLDKNMRCGAGEAIAFVDSVVHPLPIGDSVAVNDSVKRCTADSRQLLLPMSLTSAEVQRVVKSNMPRRGYAEVVTKMPLSERCSLLSAGGDELCVFVNHGGDTLRVWAANEQCDSLVLLIADTNLADTLTLRYRDKKRGATPPQSPRRLRLKSGVGATHPYYDTLWVDCETPVARVAANADSGALVSEAVEVLRLKDSTVVLCDAIFDCRGHQGKEVIGNRMRIDFQGLPGEQYQLKVLSNRFYDLYGHANDSLTIATEYSKAEDYGTVMLSVARHDTASVVGVVVQLLDEKGTVVKEQHWDEGEKIVFRHLKAGKYGLRAFYDSNADGKWTPGDYWQHRQPEAVHRFEKTLEVRANWDVEEKWLLP